MPPTGLSNFVVGIFFSMTFKYGGGMTFIDYLICILWNSLEIALVEASDKNFLMKAEKWPGPVLAIPMYLQYLRTIL